MRAVVLVGGEGTRLRPLTLTTPKPLLPLMGRAFLHHVLDHLAAHGVHEVVLSSPYLEDAFRPFIAERHGDPSVTWITEGSPMGTGGAVLNALPHLGDEPFFVLNGDILTDLDLTAMAAAHDASGATVSIATMRVDDARPFGLVLTDETGRISEFREKPTELVPGNINAGTYLITPQVLGGFPEGNVSIERVVFPELIARGEFLRAFGSQCYWADLGTPDNYRRAHFDILEGRIGGEADYPAPYVQEGCRVDLRAHLGRWVVAVDGASVAEDAQVEDSVLLSGSSVGAGAFVRDSVLGPGSSVGAGARVTACVLGAEASVPAGVILDGARVPEAD
jgi:mannose-1-phosphate guanylyltransferase